jgi:hypothetical protein
MTTNMHINEHIIVVFIFFHIINEIIRIVKAFLNAEIDIFLFGSCWRLRYLARSWRGSRQFASVHFHFVGVFLSC